LSEFIESNSWPCLLCIAGVRLAKEHGYDNELMTMALEGSKDLKLDAAKCV
jgi:hypothetical protein